MALNLRSLRKRNVNAGHISPASDQLIEKLLDKAREYWEEANNARKVETYRIDVRYGNPEIVATGHVEKELGKILVKEGLLRKIEINGGPNYLVLNLPEDEPATKETVEAKIREIEDFWFANSDATPRNERLSLTDSFSDRASLQGRYATYDRALNILGFQVFTNNLILFLEAAKQEVLVRHQPDVRYSHVIMAKRNPDLAAQEKDTSHDHVGGAIANGETRASAYAHEAKGEANLSSSQVGRRVRVDEANTFRLRGRHQFKYHGKDIEVRGIVPERIEVSVLGIDAQQLGALHSNETKPLYALDDDGNRIPDGQSGFLYNDVLRLTAYMPFEPEKILELMEDGNFEKNGKRVATLLALLEMGLVPKKDKRYAKIRNLLLYGQENAPDDSKPKIDTRGHPFRKLPRIKAKRPAP